jgi:hypothetical protein
MSIRFQFALFIAIGALLTVNAAALRMGMF